MQLVHKGVILAALLCAGAVNAQSCGPLEHSFLSCTVQSGAKALEVCVSEDSTSYRFGPAGKAPKLELSLPEGRPDLTPWIGLGADLAQEVTFTNGDTRYTVFRQIFRSYAAGESGPMRLDLDAGVYVTRGLIELTRLRCDSESIWIDF